MILEEVAPHEVGGDLIPIRYGGRTAGTTWSSTTEEDDYYIIVFGVNGCSVRWCAGNNKLID